jgi:hypothetical protein
LGEDGGVFDLRVGGEEEGFARKCREKILTTRKMVLLTRDSNGQRNIIAGGVVYRLRRL